jgi:hypothetical protein
MRCAFILTGKKTNICIEGESNEYFGSARKVETILCSAMATTRYQHGTIGCSAVGTSRYQHGTIVCSAVAQDISMGQYCVQLWHNKISAWDNTVFSCGTTRYQHGTIMCSAVAQNDISMGQ